MYGNGNFRRVADSVAVAVRRHVATIGKTFHKGRNLDDVTAGHKLFAVKHAVQRHFVLRKRARLVRTNHRRASQRLDRSKPLDNGIFARHRLYSLGKHNGNDGRQSLGYRRHSQRDGRQEDVHKHRQQRVAVTHAVYALDKCRHKHHRAHGKAHNADYFAEMFQFLLQRCKRRFAPRDKRGNLADFGIFTGSVHDAEAPTLCDKTTCIHRARVIAYSHCLQRVCRLFHRHAFPGQRRLIYLQRLCKQQFYICSHDVTRIEHGAIAANHVRAADYAQFAVAHNLGARRSQLFQFLQGFFRAEFLQCAQSCVGKHYRDDYYRFENVADVAAYNGNNKAECRRDEQDYYHKVAKLRGKHFDETRLFALFGDVGSVLYQPPCRLFGSQPERGHVCFQIFSPQISCSKVAVSLITYANLPPNSRTCPMSMLVIDKIPFNANKKTSVFQTEYRRFFVIIFNIRIDFLLT